MSIQQADFQAEIALNTAIHKWDPNVKAELSLMSTAVKADPTTHDATMQTAGGILQPGWSQNDPYKNDIALIINKGKSGNLTGAQMGAAIDAVVATLP